MKVGNLTINGLPIRLLMAPLAGVTTRPFRLLAKKFGADLTFTEMISIDGLIREQKKTLEMVDIDENEHPVGVQLFGCNPEYMARAVKRVKELGVDTIDINFGCPVIKVTKRNGGSALLKNLPLSDELIRAAVENSDLPVSIKIRSGWNSDSDVYIKLGKIAEKAGVSWITLHARNQNQSYSSEADWGKIKSLKKELSIPVVGNGDILTAADAKRMIDETGCDAVMVARGAMKDMFLLTQIKALLEEDKVLPDQSLKEKVDLAMLQAESMINYYGEDLGTRLMRKHLAWYTKGMPEGGPLRNRLMQVGSMSEIKSVLSEYQMQVTA